MADNWATGLNDGIRDVVTGVGGAAADGLSYVGGVAGSFFDGWGGEDSAIGGAIKDTKDYINSKYEVPDDAFTQSRYDFKYRVFPEDLTNSDVGHYMVININTPTGILGSGTPRSAYTGAPYRTSVLQNEFSKVDILRFGTGQGSRGAPRERLVPGSTSPGAPVGQTTQGGLSLDFSSPVQSEGFAANRATRRIAESIALFMPTPIIYTSLNDYPDSSISSMVGGAIIGAIKGAASKAGVTGGKIGDLAGDTLQAGAALAGYAGYPINPRVAVFYSNSPLRQFNFEVLMAPKSKKESMAMEEIILTLRQHAAPELDPATKGYTFIPPAEFDITFYNKGAENMHIPRINTCVLNRIDVDFAPTGTYSTFYNGYPVACRMTLGFTEIEILHKRRILQGF